MRNFGLALLVGVGFGSGCGDDHHPEDDHHDGGHEDEVGPPTGATCPDNSTLSYESFGKAFMESYCVRCHSSQLEGDARNGAPEDHDFDSLDGILDVAHHIDQMAASGPKSTNTTMPFSGDKPSLDERKMLGEWLDCELSK